MKDHLPGTTYRTPTQFNHADALAGRPSSRRDVHAKTANPHRLSRFACLRAPWARLLARCRSLAGERRARSPIGSPVRAGPVRPPAGAATTASGR